MTASIGIVDVASWWPPWTRDADAAGRQFRTRRVDVVIERMDTLGAQLEASVERLGKIAERLESHGGNESG